ncbi:MAG: phage portal protein [Aeromonas sp.]
MAWFNWNKKAYPATGSQSVWLDMLDATVTRSLDAYYKEGYEQNAIVYACVSMIAKNAASVKLEVFDGQKVLTNHPLLDFLAKPNPTQTWADFLKELITFHRVSGEAFVLRLPEKGKPVELYNLDPRLVTIKSGDKPIPQAYEYGTGTSKRVYPINPLTGESQVCHIKSVSLAQGRRGLSPLSPAAIHVDMHTGGATWNNSMLRNGARPSGVIQLAGAVAEDTIEKLKSHFQRVWQGASNRGSLPVLTGGAEFKPMSLSPTDMDFSTGMTEAAKNIALVYGVPLPLVTTEAATFSNMDAALERLWSDTVLPLLDEVIGALSDFVAPAYGPRLKLTYNADSVPAMENKRARKFERMGKAVAAGILTVDEARAEIGFDPIGANTVPSQTDPKDAFKRALRRAGYSEAEIKAEVAAEFGE